MKVLVTGANGFVATALLPALAARGHEVRTAARQPMSGRDHVVVPEVGPGTDWRLALSGCDAVVHLAARVHVMRDGAADPLAEYRRVNVEGTRRLAADAAAAGIRRFVLVSTAKVLGESSPPGRPLTDRTPVAPADPYAISKLEAEEALAEVAAGSALEPAVLRPPLVYGPGVGANFLRLMHAIDRGRILPLGAVANRRSLVYVGNLAAAIIACMEHPAAPGGRFLVTDGEDLSTPELIRRLAETLGRPARLVAVPPAVIRLAGLAFGKGAEVERLLGDFALEPIGLTQYLAWHPEYTVTAGLRATGDWFRSLGR